MGRWHAHSIKAVGRNVVAIVDQDPARARSLAARYSASAESTIEAALARGGSAVHICTPLASHASLAWTALTHGASVLIEKPFAVHATEAFAILESAAAAGLIACPVHQLPFQRGTRQAIERLPDFGPLLHVDFTACSAGADGSPERRGQLAMDILPHPLSVLRRVVTGELDSIAWHAESPMQGEVRVSGICGEVTVGILISASGRPTQNTARLVGKRGTMHLDFFHGFATFESPGVSRSRKVARPFTVGASMFAGATRNLTLRALSGEPAYPGLRELVREFYNAVEAGGASPLSREEVMDVAVACGKISDALQG